MLQKHFSLNKLSQTSRNYLKQQTYSSYLEDFSTMNKPNLQQLGYTLEQSTIMFDTLTPFGEIEHLSQSGFKNNNLPFENRLNFEILPSRINNLKHEHSFQINIIKAKIKRDRLNQLHNVIENLDQECKEEGFELVSEQAKQNIKQILNAVYEQFSDYEYHIYPTEDREIALDFTPQKGKGVLILCDSNGGVAYFSTFEGRNSRFRCDNITDFPYHNLWFIFKQFNKESIYITPPESKTKSEFTSFEHITYA